MPGYINLKNGTAQKQNLALCLDDSLIAMQEQVADGVTALFQITPTYGLSLFTNIKEGSIVSSDAAIGPIEIKFPDGMNNVEVEAYSSLSQSTHTAQVHDVTLSPQSIPNLAVMNKNYYSIATIVHYN